MSQAWFRRTRLGIAPSAWPAWVIIFLAFVVPALMIGAFLDANPGVSKAYRDLLVAIAFGACLVFIWMMASALSVLYERSIDDAVRQAIARRLSEDTWGRTLPFAAGLWVRGALKRLGLLSTNASKAYEAARQIDHLQGLVEKREQLRDFGLMAKLDSSMVEGLARAVNDRDTDAVTTIAFYRFFDRVLDEIGAKGFVGGSNFGGIQTMRGALLSTEGAGSNYPTWHIHVVQSRRGDRILVNDRTLDLQPFMPADVAGCAEALRQLARQCTNMTMKAEKNEPA